MLPGTDERSESGIAGEAVNRQELRQPGRREELFRSHQGCQTGERSATLNTWADTRPGFEGMQENQGDVLSKYIRSPSCI